MPGVLPISSSDRARSGAYTIDSSCEPSPNTGANPDRTSLNTCRKLSPSRGPYTAGGRAMTQGR